MFRKTHQRVISSIAVLLAVLFMFVFVPDANAAAGITVDGSRKFQTISALGADINPNSWDNGNLKPALDMLIDDGMKTFRVGMDMIDWESTNDNADPNTFNWNYYDPIYSGQTSFDTRYAGSNFANTWAVIDYLHQKGIPDSGIELSFMGPGPSWMGGSSLRSGMENEFVEEVLSAAYWGYTHGHTFGLFSPNSEMDITANEGITMSDTQWADVLNRLAGRMNDLGMTGVKLVGPETCCTVSYAATMRTYPTLMADLAHFDFHNYTGNDNGAAGAVAGSGKDFWISEYNAFDQSFNYLDQGAAGLQVWEAYDSVYNHAVLNGYGSNPGNDSLPFGNTPLLAYDKTTKVYSPRSNFYYFGQLFKWVPIGAQRIYANANSSSVRIEAFQDPATTRLTLVGENTGSAQTLSIALNNVDLPSALQYYQTNSGSHLARGADVPVTAGSATVTVPGNTTFTLTGLGVPDSVAPTTPADLTATGNIGSVSLAWSASSDNVGVARYNIYRSTTPGFIPSDTTRVGQATTTSFSDTGLAAGTYYYLVTAQDAAGNVSPPSNEAQATVTGDTIAPAVSVTAPGNGATVSGTVNVTASATDNVGVAGVQFKIDGTNLGSEITTPPYSTGWDTTTVANGSHSITAVARDAAGNTATSTAVPVTVSNAAPAPRLLLGLDSIQGSADNDAAGEAEAFRFTAAASGQAGTLTLYVDSGSRATNVSVGVYSDAGGRPGTLLTSGSLSAPRTAAWNTITLGTNPAINSGTPYWIAVLGTGGQLNYRDAATGSCSQSNAITGLTSLPATWSPGPTWSTCNLSAYASATARDTTAPSVSITSPTDNATISGRTTVTVSATDNVGVSKVEPRIHRGLGLRPIVDHRVGCFVGGQG